MQLRDYQQRGLDEIRRLFSMGVRRVLLHLATGGGKTLCFCTIIKLSANKGKRALVVVRGTQLIQQASERLAREGVEHGIIQGANSRKSWLPIQVCSIDTLYRRRHAPEADMIVIDEAHQTSGGGYKWFLDQYKNSFMLSVSATPHLKSGMRHVADAVVYPISIQELTDQGFLSRARYFAPEVPDLSGVRMAGDDYNEKQLDMVMRKMSLTGGIVSTWKKKTSDRISICFAVTVAHSKMLRDQFLAEGVKAEHVDADTPENIRSEIYAKLAAGEISVLCNVGILTTGFDCPPVRCIIMARPTMSYNLHIQMIGRGTRIHPGKSDFIVLDHAGNIDRHGMIEAEIQCDLDPKPKGKKAPGSAPSRTCEACMAIYPLACLVCPECGTVNPSPSKKATQEKEGDLVEVTAGEREEWERELDKLIRYARERGHKKGWLGFKLKDKFGENRGDQIWRQKIQRLKKWPAKGETGFLETRTLAWSALSYWQSDLEKIAESGKTTQERLILRPEGS